MAELLERIERAGAPLLYTMSPPQARVAFQERSEVLDLPRAAMLTHRALATHAVDSALTMGGNHRDVVLHTIPLFHVNGWGTPHWVTVLGGRHVMLERFDEALQWGEQALREMPNYGSSHRVVIGALVGLQRLDEARAAARRLLEAFPTYNLTLQRQINPWRDQAFGERYLEALRVAGIPE